MNRTTVTSGKKVEGIYLPLIVPIRNRTSQNIFKEFRILYLIQPEDAL